MSGVTSGHLRCYLLILEKPGMTVMDFCDLYQSPGVPALRMLGSLAHVGAIHIIGKLADDPCEVRLWPRVSYRGREPPPLPESLANLLKSNAK